MQVKDNNLNGLTTLYKWLPPQLQVTTKKKKNHFSLFELKKILLYKAKPLYIIQVDNGSMPFHIIVLYGFAQILQLWKCI